MARSRSLRPEDSSPNFEGIETNDDRPPWMPPGEGEQSSTDETAASGEQHGDAGSSDPEPAEPDREQQPDDSVIEEAGEGSSSIFGGSSVFGSDVVPKDASPEDASNPADSPGEEPAEITGDPPLPDTRVADAEAIDASNTDAAVEESEPVGAPDFIAPSAVPDDGEDRRAGETAAVPETQTEPADPVAPGTPAVDTSDNPAVDASTDEPSTVQPAAAPAPVSEPKSKPESKSQQPSDTIALSRPLVIGLVSYASAVTIAFLYLLMQIGGRQQHDLESLPDIAPLEADQIQVAPEEAALAPGHVLQLGESRRFGNIVVEPLRVTRGPVAFEHYSGDDQKTREPDAEVLKLWLRFENVSDEQTIAPLDSWLMLTRIYNDNNELRTNNFLREKSDEPPLESKVFLYDHPATSEWNLAGQQLGRQLAPGDELVTYIASEPEAVEMDGRIVWRIQFRKGYHDQSGNGVTTLIEIEHPASEIQRETKPARA